MDEKNFYKNIAEATSLMKTLANSNRLSVLCQLSSEEKCVNDLLTQLSISQSALSQNLKIMKDEGLIDCRRDGNQIFYFVNNPAVKKILQLLHDMYCTGEKS